MTKNAPATTTTTRTYEVLIGKKVTTITATSVRRATRNVARDLVATMKDDAEIYTQVVHTDDAGVVGLVLDANDKVLAHVVNVRANAAVAAA